MYLNVSIPMYQIKKHTIATYESEGNLNGFPLLSLDKDSYINGAQIQSGIDCYPGKQVHSIQIGKYCSLAPNIRFMIDLNHDYLGVSTAYVTEFKDRKEASEEPVFPGFLRRKGEIIIQNDCWIGDNVTIMAGATIHNGAVVAAGSVVRGDIPPYSIVAGNPAQVVKYRFPQHIISSLQKIAWWNWSSEKLSENYETMQGTVESFVEMHLSEAETRIQQLESRANPVDQLSHGKIYSFCMDIESNFPVYPRVIDEFCQRFQSKDAQIVLYIPSNCENKEAAMNVILDALAPYQDFDCVIQIIDDDNVTMYDIIRHSDYYITNRSADNIKNTCIADYYGKKIVAGVNSPIF